MPGFWNKLLIGVAFCAFACSVSVSVARAAPGQAEPLGPAQESRFVGAGADVHDAQVLRVLAPVLGRISASPNERLRLLSAVGCGQVKNVRSVLSANGFPTEEFARLPIDLQGATATDRFQPGTLYLHTLKSRRPIQNASDTVGLVQVAPGEWISWSLLSLWMMGGP